MKCQMIIPQQDFQVYVQEALYCLHYEYKRLYFGYQIFSILLQDVLS